LPQIGQGFSLPVALPVSLPGPASAGGLAGIQPAPQRFHTIANSCDLISDHYEILVLFPKKHILPSLAVSFNCADFVATVLPRTKRGSRH
jgi:hypothetical protein